MEWAKRGWIFGVDGDRPWRAHHAQLPLPLVRDGNLRVLYAARDGDGRARVGRFDADPADPSSIRAVADDPVLDLGQPGRFDDAGTMPSCLVEADGRLLLYYVGWTLPPGARHQTAIGLAESVDDGVTFNRVTEDPLGDLTPAGSPGCSTCFVLREPGRWRMWFTSSSRWVNVRGHDEELYGIRYAESDDGLRWRPREQACIAPRHPTEASGRPWVVRDADRYRMWFSHRDVDGFRDDPARSYRIGYAESSDGLAWQRLDEQVGIDVADDGWDSEMLAYPSVYDHAGTRHLLYNGNGFGASGIGHAVAAP